MHLKEECISSKEIFNGKIFKIKVDDVKLENGKTSIREVVHHNGGVCILPLTDKNEVIFVKQFRYPYMETVLELPAGKLEAGEEHYSAGKRELLEETGCTCKEFRYMGYMIPTPAYCQEITHMYLATGLEGGKQNLDDDEFLEVVKIPLDKAVEMVMNGEIEDGKTQLALLKAKMILG